MQKRHSHAQRHGHDHDHGPGHGHDGHHPEHDEQGAPGSGHSQAPARVGQDGDNEPGHGQGYSGGRDDGQRRDPGHADGQGHGHGHDDDHGHGHGHDHTHGANERSVGLAAILTAVFMFAEVAGGWLAGSLALLADAGHMLTDFASLALAWLGFRLARRPADWRRTYGFDRFSVLVAFVNGMALFALAAWIVVEAVQRLRAPVAVLGGLMLWVAVAGLAVNVVVFLILRRGDSHNLNVRAAFLHVVGDLLGSVAAVVASLVILGTGWMPIDPLLSIVVALIILRSAWRVVADSGHILLEGSPPGFDARAVKDDICAALPYVLDVHHVHAWSICQERPMVTLHANVTPATSSTEAVREIKAMLAKHFRIEHATVEIEYGACVDEHAERRTC